MKAKTIIVTVVVALIIIIAAWYAYTSYQSVASQAPQPAGASVSTDGSPQGILPYKSGIRGIVLVGPTCPPHKSPPDRACYMKPLAASVAVFRKSNPASPFATGKSDAVGTFMFSLPPGDYTVGAGDAEWPKCPHPSVTVAATGYTATTLICTPAPSATQ